MMPKLLGIFGCMGYCRPVSLEPVVVEDCEVDSEVDWLPTSPAGLGGSYGACAVLSWASATSRLASIVAK